VTDPGRTPDGHHIVVGDRRWRATDPGIPEKLRAELVAELMAARRLVRTDPDAARPRVQDAKVALGERGAPWWDQPDESAQKERLTATVRALLRHRAGGSICPSDAARVVGGEGWRGLMATARGVAAELAVSDVVVVTQRGQPVDAATAHGPVRISPGPRLDSPG
jgi:hypothetical protein